MGNRNKIKTQAKRLEIRRKDYELTRESLQRYGSADGICRPGSMSPKKSRSVKK